MKDMYGQLMQMDMDSYDDVIRKFKVLEENKANIYAIDYVNSLIRNVNIEIFGRDLCSAVDLVYGRQLEGYCWQTTSMLIPFFSKNGYISRGYLYFSDTLSEYYHSWINFSLDGNDYVFDPCLSFLCAKELYDEMFMVECKYSISSLKVRERLLYYLNNGFDDYVEILGTDNIDAPFYRLNAKVRGKVKNNKILSMDVKY